jgi:RNA polymerase-interacting CarD/CdnL/TRCF family regulator
MVKLNLAISALLSGAALTVANNDSITHALVQWKKGQRTPIYQTLCGLNCTEMGKVPASKGLTIERIGTMVYPVSSRASVATLCALIAAVESGNAPDSAALTFKELHKVSKADAKIIRQGEVNARRTEKQAQKIKSNANKRALEKAEKTLAAAVALVESAGKSGALSNVQAQGLAQALTVTQTGKALI